MHNISKYMIQSDKYYGLINGLLKKLSFLNVMHNFKVNPENTEGIVRHGRWKMNVYEFSRLESIFFYLFLDKGAIDNKNCSDELGQSYPRITLISFAAIQV